MFFEILDALAALATVGGFVIDVAGMLCGRTGKNARMRMEREEEGSTASEDEQGPE